MISDTIAKMTKRGFRLLNLLLFFSFVLFIAVFILTIFQSDKQHALVLNLFPIFLMVVGVMVIVLTPHTRSAYQLFIGDMFAFAGLFSYLLMESIIPGNLLQWWPIYSVAAGLCVFISGIYRYRKFDFGYIIPAVVMVILGGWFLLFSFKIITIPFKMFILMFGPLLALMLFLLLLAIYFHQKKYRTDSDSNTEINQFEDDEMIPE